MGEFLALVRRILAGETVLGVERKRVRKDGTPIEVAISSTGLAGPDGSSHALVAYVEDITARKRAEAERTRLLEAEREARREAENALAVREDFLTIASHDLKTPLSALRMQIEGMHDAHRRGRLAPEMIERGLAVAERQVERLVRLAQRLLELARIRTGRLALEKQSCDLSAIAGEICERYEPALRRAGCALTLDVPPVAAGVWDRDRIEEVVENLLSNAMKFGEGRPVRVAVASEGSRVRVTVEDHGIGISPELRDRIFERFERGSNSLHYGGLGMGLYISKNIVEAHGGTLTAQSAPGAGSTFVAEFPA